MWGGRAGSSPLSKEKSLLYDHEGGDNTASGWKKEGQRTLRTFSASGGEKKGGTTVPGR